MKILSPSSGALLLACAAFATTAPRPAVAAGHAHQHGIARLDIAVEPRRITLQFSSPLDNLLGFERAPRNDAERGRSQAAIERLKAASALFRIDPAAQCRAGAVTLSSPALSLGDAADPATGAKADSHADLDATYVFDCADAARAAQLEHALFAFAGLQRLEVQIAAPSGQARRTLKRPEARIALGGQAASR